ncbi:MAG: membrane integrity-associated transporter subunit PqiC [Burkholderiaceae bacterium]|nr:membrane integrity-associated transporter subunit PqiC [Burkholderiaceae bacterium]
MHILTHSARGFGRALALSGLALLAALSLGGCSANRGAAPTQLDLGAGVATPKAALPANPAIAVPVASGAALLNEVRVIWRVGDQGQPQAYATFQWVAPPAHLVTQRIIDRLALQGAVLPQNVGGELPQLRMNLQRFEQTFSADGATSKGQLTMQVVLVRGSRVSDQLLIDLQVPATTQDAPGGAVALRTATEQAADQIAQWLSKQLAK